MSHMPTPQPPPSHTDPLVGTQRETDSAVENDGTPDQEVRLRRDADGRPRRSRHIAGALGVLLGGLGAHRFYLEYRRLGAIQMAVTLGAFVLVLLVARLTGATWSNALTTGAGVAMLGMLWGAIEGLCILAGMMRRDGRGRPLTRFGQTTP